MSILPRHWELDEAGQPTQVILDRRREAKFVTPVPSPRRRRDSGQQKELVFEDVKGWSARGQQYAGTAENVNEIRPDGGFLAADTQSFGLGCVA